MKIVIDSNILFSALRGKNSRTRVRILTSKDQYFTPNFIITEIFKHKERIVKDSDQPENDTLEYLSQILNRVTFINEKNISTRNFIKAYELCKSVDEDDTPFVAIALELGYQLWTRDKELKAELSRKGFFDFYDESEE